MTDKNLKARQLPDPLRHRTGWPWTREQEGGASTGAEITAWPRITVVTPSFNQGGFIEQTIRSVLLQGYPNLEYIVIDGGSTDETLEIISHYAPWIDQWVSEPDRGQSHAINKGFERASGHLLAWLNSDDVYMPGALRTVAEASRRWPDAGAFVGMGHKVNEEGRITYTPPRRDLSFSALLDWEYSHFLQPSCFFTREAWLASGPIDERLNYALDVDLWVRMAQHVEFQKIDGVLSHALAHEDAKTESQRERSRVEAAVVAMRYGGEEYALRELKLMADELKETRAKLRQITMHPLAWPVRTARRALRRIRNRQ